MRTRQEIEKDSLPDPGIPVENDVLITLRAILETNLDIRELLARKSRKVDENTVCRSCANFRYISVVDEHGKVQKTVCPDCSPITPNTPEV